MPPLTTNSSADKPHLKHHPFRRAVLRGLGTVLPPLLTIVVFIWAWTLIAGYVLRPVEGVASWMLIRWEWDVRRVEPPPAEIDRFRQLSTGHWIPRHVFDEVTANPGETRPNTAIGYYQRYVRVQYLKPWIVVPVFLFVFIGTLYLLGRFLTAGMGRWTWNSFESLIQRLPVIRNVYSSVKQVTDFVFTEQTIEFNRVVAVEYPSKGIWSIGFATGESMLDMWSAANEPMVSVLIPTSPMPMTGFTITVRRSDIVDMDLTVDQAIQFIVSCGVVVPVHQIPPRSNNDSPGSSDLFLQPPPAHDRNVPGGQPDGSGHRAFPEQPSPSSKNIDITAP